MRFLLGVIVGIMVSQIGLVPLAQKLDNGVVAIKEAVR